MPALTNASLRCWAQPRTVASAAGLLPWKWQLPPSEAMAAWPIQVAARMAAVLSAYFMVLSFEVRFRLRLG